MPPKSFVRSLVLSIGSMLLLCGGAAAATTTTVSTTCTQGLEYQPFLPWNDGNWYSPLPGESYDNFDGTGWTLSAGAGLTTTTLYDGQGSVLNLPKGATAVSPAFCVNNTYPYMRMMFDAINGGSITASFSYLQTNGTWKSAMSAGSVSSSSSVWVLSGQVRIPSGPYSGWNLAKLTLVGNGGRLSTSTAEVYNIYADPRMKH